MADLRKLKHEALEAAGGGNWRKAATCYAKLEREEPLDSTWSLKLGESLRRLGNDTEAVKAFARAAAGYAKGDLLLKAIAVCKMILGIDPSHTETQDMLAGLYASQKQPTPAAAARPRPTPAQPTPPVPAAKRPEPPSPAAPAPAPSSTAAQTSTDFARAQPGAHAPARQQAPTPRPPAPPLRQLRLAALVPGSRQSSNLPASGSSAAMEIPVDDEFASEPPRPTSPHKGAGRRTMATFVLPKTPFFSVLTPALMRMAIERVRLIPLPAGEVLFSKGDPGDDLFVVAWGEVAVLLPREVARLCEGELFGEIALLSDRPRTATVRATVDSQVLAFDRGLLSDLVGASPDLLVVLLRFLRERLIVNLAESSQLFAPFTPLERLALAARFRFIEVDEGFRMVEEGGRSAGLFVLLAGEAAATAGGQVIAHLLPGEVFGEMSLMSGQPATASVTAGCKSFLLFLPRTDFSEVIMTHPQVLEYLSSVAEARAQAVGRLDLL